MLSHLLTTTFTVGTKTGNQLTQVIYVNTPVAGSIQRCHKQSSESGQSVA